MLIAAITEYSVSVFLHITAVVVGLGASFAEAIALPVALRTSPRHLPYVHRLQLAINRWLVSPALVVIVATGVYQTIDGDWGFDSFWISAVMAIVIAIGGLVGAYFIPSDRKLGAMVEAEVAAAGAGEMTPSEEYMRGARTQGRVGGLVGLLIIAAIFLMVTKPGA